MNILNTVMDLLSSNITATGFGFLLFTLLCLQISFLSKRTLRKGEMRHLITLIRDPYGNSNAIELCKKCPQKARVYYIPLANVGVKGGRKGLMREAFTSQSIADQNGKLMLAGKGSLQPNPGWWHTLSREEPLLQH